MKTRSTRTLVRTYLHFHCIRFAVGCPRAFQPAVSFTPVRSRLHFLLPSSLRLVCCRQTRDSTHRSVMRIRSFTQVNTCSNISDALSAYLNIGARIEEDETRALRYF